MCKEVTWGGWPGTPQADVPAVPRGVKGGHQHLEKALGKQQMEREEEPGRVRGSQPCSEATEAHPSPGALGQVPGTAPGLGFIWILITICAPDPSPLIPFINSHPFPRLNSVPISQHSNIPTFQRPQTPPECPRAAPGCPQWIPMERLLQCHRT